MKDQPDPGVLTWATALEQSEVTISVVTVQEIERGLARLPVGRRQRTLTDRWHQLLEAYADMVLMYDVPAAQAAATVLVYRETAAGRSASPTPRSPGHACRRTRPWLPATPPTSPASPA